MKNFYKRNLTAKPNKRNGSKINTNPTTIKGSISPGITNTIKSIPAPIAQR